MDRYRIVAILTICLLLGVPGAVSAQDDIIVSPDSLAFTAIGGDTLPSSQGFNLECYSCGGEGGKWYVTDDVDWLYCTPVEGYFNVLITVRVTTTDLSPGMHTAIITVFNASANNSPLLIPVTYEVIVPDIVVDPFRLEFEAFQNGDLPADVTFDLRCNNSSTPENSWSITEDTPWLEVSPTSGTDTSAVITVSVNTTSLGLSFNRAWITISSPGASNDPKMLEVVYNIIPPDLRVAPRSLDFEVTKGDPLPPEDTVSITCVSTGCNITDWELTDDAYWLDATPVSGGSGTSNVRVSVNTSDLAEGTHTATMTVTGPANNSPVTIDVVYEVTENSPPGDFHRLLPEDDILLSASEIEFVWTESIDPDEDEVTYALTLSIVEGSENKALLPTLDTVIATTDTSLIVDVSDLSGGALNVTWSVSATDGRVDIPAVNGEGSFELDVQTDVDDPLPGQLPTAFVLFQNYPNPFNPATTIEYSLPERSFVTIDIYNLLGQQVKSLISGDRAAGLYRVDWNGSDNNGRQVSSGVYLYRYTAGDQTQTRTMLLLK